MAVAKNSVYGLKNNLNKNKYDEFREILIKFDLRVRIKVPILISLKN